MRCDQTECCELSDDVCRMADDLTPSVIYRRLVLSHERAATGGVVHHLAKRIGVKLPA